MKQKNDLDRWMQMHTDATMLKELETLVRESWERSLNYKVDYINALPEEIPPKEFARIKQANKRICIYTSSIISFPLTKIQVPESGVLLFDNTGCLLQIYGQEVFRAWAEVNQIKIGTRWTEQAIGANVVSLGMRLEGTVTLIGSENYSRFLTNGIFAYSPIKLENGELLGSVVLAAPLRTQVTYLRPLSFMVAREVELQMFWFNMIGLYSNVTENIGIICLDQSTGQNRVLITNDETIKLLGLVQKDYFYDKLETIIDMTEENEQFWSIVNNKTKVRDMRISLMVKGRKTEVSLSTSAYKETIFHMNGIFLYMHSIKHIKKLVAQYGGNIARYGFEDIIGESKPMLDVVHQAKNASLTDSNILLLGESGVGKDVLAQAIHNSSRRKGKPFVAINCAAFSKELISSELFGYEAGAFTGSRKEGQMGKFELANQGTLFLDEIGDMPMDLQAVLLRVLEEGCFRKVGGNTIVNVNVRIIAASNKNLKEKVANGQFRGDLFYRLGVVRILIPPLRHRGSDMRLFINFFIKQICARLNKPTVTLSKNALEFLNQYPWPGNVRELRNLLEGIINTTATSVIDDSEIRRYLGDFEQQARNREDYTIAKERMQSEDEYIYDERREFSYALKLCNNNKTKAASYLNMPLSTFYRRLKKYGMFC
ncbi:transcriptional regulator containing PAS, AAA-type ATPase, and DNA-binding domains [Desulfitobacterium dichloroeliminans LMG P-21439]|uniref:Transcriptional regulator containing PAS, AAA-type ATPase, and DNA-binding domains n=1 Tax=Desulfitobacterium dichloroeliminans (strain LMG P-21439 / DCA1) TaxID=871963 RepID=L0F5C6_DESDL|nr:sigma 54-interacting transcriptional regulator [Desulfitobacterium dichloroeliminans]AGA68245.1 transcriptional regulator containing PAS, AAA-type ATPase, and DNA-binding domains [Desulfitobacterium dichloroeliminans LMG P-21439]